jgi:glycosyltransferase involved in cell wall biosynthesis
MSNAFSPGRRFVNDARRAVDVPLISVILPHFGCERYLFDAVSSILHQELGELELKVVDDASPTDDWLQAIAKLRGDPRLTLYRTTQNVGPYRIKNRLIRATASPYIAFQDADDVSHPTRFRQQLQMMKRTGAQIVGCGFSYIAEDGRLIARQRMVRHVNLWMRFGKSFAALHPTTIVRSEIFETLGGFDGTTHFAADADFFLRAAHLYRIRNARAYLYDYRIRSNSLSTAQKTGLHSQDRARYAGLMQEREQQRRALRGEALRLSLLAPPNDIDFDLVKIT